MTYGSMRIERDKGVARLIFTQGKTGNPINGAFCSEFCDAANKVSEDRSIRALMILAEGKAFSFGGDITGFVTELDRLPLMIKRWTADLHAGIARLLKMDAPLIIAVHGMCAGGMNGLAAASDIMLAADNARFVAAYAGIGFCNDAGTSITLSRRMGIARARRFLLMNETLDAAQALACGLVDEVLPGDALTARAEAVARQFADGPTRAYGEIRRLLNSVSDQPAETQLELEALALARTAGTADAREGIMAFAEKRKPQFRGE